MFHLFKNKQLKVDYQKLNEKYEEVRNREVQKKSEWAHLREIKKESELIDWILKDYQIIGVAINNHNEKQYVRLYYDTHSINISLYNVQTRHPHPRLYAKIHQDFHEMSTTCELMDLFAEDENSGNGTILLKHLFKHLKKQNVSKVKGGLSYVDKNQFDKLEHFYKKNGFKVIFNEDRTSGRITLTL